jgi:methyl-accepting chemotaxis protein
MFIKRFVTASLRNQMLAGFIFVIVAFVIALVIAVTGISSVSSTVRKGYSSSTVADEAAAAGRDMHASEVADALSVGKELANHEGDVATFRGLYEKLSTNAHSAADEAGRAQITAAFNAWSAINKQIEQLAPHGVTPTLTNLVLGPANETGDALSNALDSYAALRRHDADSAASSATTSRTLLVAVIALLALAAALAVALLLSRGIVRGLNGVAERLKSLDENCLSNLRGGLEAIKDGTLTRGVTPVTSPLESSRADEIGQLIDTFNAMLDKTQASIAAYEQMREQLGGALGDRSCLEDLLERMQSLQNVCLSNLQGALESMAGGDLTVGVTSQTTSVPVEVGRRAGRLAEIFNAMLLSTQSAIESYEGMRGKLNGMLGDVTRTSQTVSAASQQMASTSGEAGSAVGEIAHAVGDVAAGAERQVNSVESVRTAVEQVASATEEAADNLRQTGEAASEATEVAQGGIQAAEKASEAMAAVAEATGAASERIRELGEKSERIGGIVATITGIAEQTNLLALNAAIEAARAGEQGRGFAVVAEEVRKLAEDSQQAAALIEELIGEIQTETHRAVEAVELGAQRTEDGVQTVDEARGKFEDIGGSVTDMNDRITEVTAAMAQITASTQGILESVSDVAAVAEENSASTEQVSASTQQTAASTEQISASAQSLAGTAEHLDELVSHFVLSAA